MFRCLPIIYSYLEVCFSNPAISEDTYFTITFVVLGTGSNWWKLCVPLICLAREYLASSFSLYSSSTVSFPTHMQWIPVTFSLQKLNTSKGCMIWLVVVRCKDALAVNLFNVPPRPSYGPCKCNISFINDRGGGEGGALPTLQIKTD